MKNIQHGPSGQRKSTAILGPTILRQNGEIVSNLVLERTMKQDLILMKKKRTRLRTSRFAEGAG